MKLVGEEGDKDLTVKISQAPRKPRGPREAVLQDLWVLYLKDRTNRRIENWKRYIAFLKLNRLPNTAENQKKFKKSKSFIKELTEANFCILFAHCKGDDGIRDLYTLLSKAKQAKVASACILGEIKVK